MAVKSPDNQNITKDPKFKIEFDLIISERRDYYDYNDIIS